MVNEGRERLGRIEQEKEKEGFEGDMKGKGYRGRKGREGV